MSETNEPAKPPPRPSTRLGRIAFAWKRTSFGKLLVRLNQEVCPKYLPAWFLEKGWGRWVRLALLTGALMYASPYIESWLKLETVRDWMFQTFSQSALNRAKPRYDVRVVEIRDDDFWGETMAHRSPTNRKHLAQIIRALDDQKIGVRVIALDFDLRLPNPEQPAERGAYALNEPYKTETDDLMRAVADAAEHGRTIILARTIGRYRRGAYILEPDGYLPYGICNRDEKGTTNPGTPEFPLRPPAPGNIVCGYISLPYDMRQVAPAIDVHPSGTLDSFALAIVRATDPGAAAELNTGTRYATYISEEAIRESGLVVSARALVDKDPAAIDAVRRATIVIVGAGWHTWAVGRGPLVDVHETPTGEITGALIHANFVQAILSDRLFQPVGDPILKLVEFIFCFLAGVALAAPWHLVRKTAILVGFVAFFFAAQWLALYVFGAFFEAFVPFMGVLIHGVSHRLLHREPSSANVPAGGST